VLNTSPPGSLLSFIAAEHENELVSTLKHAQELQWLSRIDGLLRAPIADLDVPKGLQAIAQLYLFITFHLYTTVVNLMRLHLAEALGCERKAIDAALSAYEMLTDSESISAYHDREWKFLNIKAFIDKARKKDPEAYPLARDLLCTWDHCSEFGAHADLSTFAGRLNQTPIAEDPDKQLLHFFYFQAPSSEDEARFLYVDVFANFIAMSKIFDPLFKAHSKGVDWPNWVKSREDVEGAILGEWQRLKTKLEAEAG
jgi:hypothetical protein